MMNAQAILSILYEIGVQFSTIPICLFLFQFSDILGQTVNGTLIKKKEPRNNVV